MISLIFNIFWKKSTKKLKHLKIFRKILIIRIIKTMFKVNLILNTLIENEFSEVLSLQKLSWIYLLLDYVDWFYLNELYLLKIYKKLASREVSIYYYH